MIRFFFQENVFKKKPSKGWYPKGDGKQNSHEWSWSVVCRFMTFAAAGHKSGHKLRQSHIWRFLTHCDVLWCHIKWWKRQKLSLMSQSVARNRKMSLKMLQIVAKYRLGHPVPAVATPRQTAQLFCVCCAVVSCHATEAHPWMSMATGRQCSVGDVAGSFKDLFFRPYKRKSQSSGRSSGYRFFCGANLHLKNSGGKPKYKCPPFWGSTLFYKASPWQSQPPKWKLTPSKM